DRARRRRTRGPQTVRREPARWVNMAILDLKRNDMPAAEQALQTAQSHAPPSSPIELLLGVIASRGGRSDEALTHFRRAVELDGKNLIARYSLNQELARVPGAPSEA